jgi:LemA protein
LSNLKNEAWSGIDVQLRRRFDLVPNLVETVKGYAAHERTTFQEVTNARSAISNATTQNARIDAENALTGTLRKLFAVAEAYPELKASAHFMELQAELSSLENDLQLARRYYNGTVRDYNITIQSFPAILISRQLGYKEAEMFETDEESRQPVKVQF